MMPGNSEFCKGLILKGVGGLYYIQGNDGTQQVLRAKGKFRKQHIKPIVGDHVLYSPGQGEEHGWIEEILPRRNVLIRPPVANVTSIILVIAPQPAPDLLLIDTLLIMAWEQQIDPVLVINKCDLDTTLGADIRKAYAKLSLPVLEVSAKSKKGIEDLQKVMRQGICCFAGQSGVGKSTILSVATGLSLETGEISRKIARGKHTTRHAEIMTSGEYCVLDTPGFSLLELWDRLEPIQLKTFYPEFMPYEGHCRFAPCYHLHEPDCAVLKAVSEGALPAERMERYHILLQKVQRNWRERYE